MYVLSKALMKKIKEILKKEIKEDLNKWRDIPCLGVGRLDTIQL